MISPLVNIVKAVKYRLRYPGLDIPVSANLATDVALAGNVMIGDGVSIKSSTLGQGTTVHRQSNLFCVMAENNVTIYDHGTLSEVDVGGYSYVAANAKISMTKIGRFCSIGPSLVCGYGDHPVNWLSTSPVFFSTGKQCGVTFADKNYFQERRNITIGNDVWIGSTVYIRDGVSIGNGAIVAAGAVVVNDVPDYAIVGGVPAKIIRFRFDEATIQKLLGLQWWNWTEKRLREAQAYFVNDSAVDLVDWSLDR